MNPPLPPQKNKTKNSEYLSLKLLNKNLTLKHAFSPNAHSTVEILLGIHSIKQCFLHSTPFCIIVINSTGIKSHLRIDNIRKLWLIHVLMYIPSWALVYHSSELQDSSSPLHPVMLQQIMSLISLTLTFMNDFGLWPWVINIVVLASCNLVKMILFLFV